MVGAEIVFKVVPVANIELARSTLYKYFSIYQFYPRLLDFIYLTKAITLLASRFPVFHGRPCIGGLAREIDRRELDKQALTDL